MIPIPLELATEDPPARTLRLVHQHAHDVRNQLNCLELDLMVLGELAGDHATADCVARLRANLTAVEQQVKSLVLKFADPNPIVVAAEDLMRMWQGQVRPMLRPDREMEWRLAARPASVRLDVRAVVAGLTELTVAAWSRAAGRPLAALLVVSDASASVSLREPGAASSLTPDLLREMDRLATANNGRMVRGPAEDMPGWVTTFTFPVLPRHEGVA